MPAGRCKESIFVGKDQGTGTSGQTAHSLAGTHCRLAGSPAAIIHARLHTRPLHRELLLAPQHLRLRHQWHIPGHLPTPHHQQNDAHLSSARNLAHLRNIPHCFQPLLRRHHTRREEAVHLAGAGQTRHVLPHLRRRGLLADQEARLPEPPSVLQEHALGVAGTDWRRGGGCGQEWKGGGC